MNYAWLAGYFDGEGCVYLQRDKRPGSRASYNLQITLTQKTHNVTGLLTVVCSVSQNLLEDKRFLFFNTFFLNIIRE